MMLTISGLPPTTKYKDLKVLIKTRCNLADFILDDLVGDNNGLKKVRIGLADSNEGAHLIKCLAGYRMSGCPLSVTPVGKTQIPGPGPQQNFNQPRSDYQNDYNDPRPSPWGQQGNQQSQWTPNPVGQQMPQNTFGYQHQQGAPMQNNQYMPQQQAQNPIHHNQHLNQPHQNQQVQRPQEQFPQRGPQNQGYGFQPKNNMPESVPAPRSHVLRTVEIVDTPLNRPAVQPNRQPHHGFNVQDKPMTIMKDNFQGPSHYNLSQGGPPGPTQSSWIQQEQQQKSFKPNLPPFNDPKGPSIKPQELNRANFKNYDKDYDKLSREMRKSPYRKMSPRRSPGRRHSPGRGSPRRHSPRRMSPGRRSPGRRMSPARRSPGRRVSPSHRPLEHERRMSPGRGLPVTERAWRRASPAKRSPERRPDPGSLRYSPSRHLDKSDEFIERAGNKPVRPAYDPPTQAQNQAMYSGGYRPNVHEKVPYPTPGQRAGEQRESTWQQERDKALFNETIKKREVERAAPRSLPFERPGVRLDKEQRSHSPRKSRSPLRRDKSPSRDRFKRHSPSPRSPRRSWALEKRRSPDLGDAPPPPIWPGQINEKKPNFVDIEVRRKPVWEYDKKALDESRPDDDRRFPVQEGIRVRRDLGPVHAPERREEIDFKRDDRFPREGPKFSPRDDFDKKGPKFSPRDDFDKRGPKFSPRDDFDKKGPKFSPRDDFDKKGPRFSPREDFEKKPMFAHRDDFEDKRPKFTPRDDFVKAVKVPKFSPREDYQAPSFSRDDMIRKSNDFDRPKFSPRDDYDDRRDDLRKHEVPERKNWEVPKPSERDLYRGGDFPPKREDAARMELRRDMLRKMSEELDKQFEDVHKRAQDFHKRAEEYRRDDRRKEYDRREPEPKHRDDDRRDFRHDERRKEDWNTDEHLKKKALIQAAIKAKKEKAVEEISQKILDKHNIDSDAEQNARVCQELRFAVSRAINEMFGDSDVSFIELIIKFNAKYSGAGEDKILRDVMASFPSQFRPKRSAPDYASEVPAKSSRRSPEPDLNKGVNPISAPHVPEWNMTPAMPTAAPLEMYPQPHMMPPVMPPVMQPVMPPVMMGPAMMMPGPMARPFRPFRPFQGQFQQQTEGFNLYLCKDDFEPFSELQADYLRKFLIDQIIKVTETSQGWSPDFTFKGLQSSCRYELQTRDEASKNWLINFDFSQFQFFNILVYTNEELWYERAAIWLPGHSRCRNIEPLTKLKLQNKKLEGANVGKWKLVKKVVTTKGTRVYVDMPPSAARALEKHKMSLSYELQKVSVFLKAVAIDKDAFDLGLKDPTITEESELAKAALNSPMPSLGQDPKIVKICLAGNKPLTIPQARKVREMLIYNIFKYHQQDGKSCTDFEKHGFVSPGYFGVLPDNAESKRWLMGLNIGKLNKQSVVILGADDTNTRHIKMTIMIPNDIKANSAMVLERLKQSNQGVKGINFSKWRPLRLAEDRSKYRYEVDIDLESIESIIKMKYMLDYVDDKHPTKSVPVKYDKSERHLLDLIKRYKAELHDTYDDANMDLGSSDSENDDIVCLN